METLITNIGQLVSPVDSRPTSKASSLVDVGERPQILIRDGRIAAVGGVDRPGQLDAEIDAGGGVVLPGLIDPHTHFGAPARADERGDDPAVVRERTRVRLRRALFNGVTTVEVKCQTVAELSEVASLSRSGDESLPELVPTLFGAPPPPGTTHAERMADLIGDAIPTVRRRRLALFCDVACGDEAYGPEEARTILRAARAAGLHLKLHASGGPMGALTAVAAELGVTAVGHPGDLGDREGRRWRDAGVTAVLLPGEALLRGRPAASARRMVGAGLTVGLGTDVGSPSTAIGSMWLVIALAVSVLGMSLEQTLAAATLYNAHALELAADIGSVEPGRRADLLVLDVADYRDLLGALGEAPIRTVIRAGKVVHQR